MNVKKIVAFIENIVAQLHEELESGNCDELEMVECRGMIDAYENVLTYIGLQERKEQLLNG